MSFICIPMRMNLIKAHGGKGSGPFSFERSATSPPQADHVLVDLFFIVADWGAALKSPTDVQHWEEQRERWKKGNIRWELNGQKETWPNSFKQKIKGQDWLFRPSPELVRTSPQRGTENVPPVLKFMVRFIKDTMTNGVGWCRKSALLLIHFIHS